MAKARVRTQRQPIETELKLTFPPDAANRLADHPAFKRQGANAPRSERIVSTYFDTPSHELARRGLSLRIRAVGKLRVQTLKWSGANGGAAMSRGEWEWPVKDDKPDIALASSAPAVSRLPADLGKQLQPIVVTDVMRTAHTLDFQGSTIEAVLDSGSIVAGDQKQPVHELELELHHGALTPPSMVWPFRCTRLRRFPLKPRAKQLAATASWSGARQPRKRPLRSNSRATSPPGTGFVRSSAKS